MAFSCEIITTILCLEGLLCSYNSGNVINSDLWQLRKHVHACPTEHEIHAPSLTVLFLQHLFAFLQNLCTSALKEAEIPVKMSGFLFYFARLTDSGGEEIFTHFYTQAASRNTGTAAEKSRLFKMFQVVLKTGISKNVNWTGHESRPSASLLEPAWQAAQSPNTRTVLTDSPNWFIALTSESQLSCPERSRNTCLCHWKGHRKRRNKLIRRYETKKCNPGSAGCTAMCEFLKFGSSFSIWPCFLEVELFCLFSL